MNKRIVVATFVAEINLNSTAEAVTTVNLRFVEARIITSIIGRQEFWSGVIHD